MYDDTFIKTNQTLWFLIIMNVVHRYILYINIHAIKLSANAPAVLLPTGGLHHSGKN